LQLLLAFNVWYGGKLSSTVMNDTIKANDIWNFYQAKSIKQTQYELAAQQTNDPVKAKKFEVKSKTYDEGKEGKPELFKAAKALEAERDYAKTKSPWIGYAGTAYQLSIVLLSASILAVSIPLFYGSFVLCLVGLILMGQGLFSLGSKMKKLLSPSFAFLTLASDCISIKSNFIESIRLRYFDTLITSKQQTVNNIYTVNIDEATLDKYGQWQFKRDQYANLIAQLYTHNARFSCMEYYDA
jgi:hypothetical protein